MFERDVVVHMKIKNGNYFLTMLDPIQSLLISVHLLTINDKVIFNKKDKKCDLKI